MSEAISLEQFVEGEAKALADACTACARCVEVCPVVPHAGLEGAAPEPVAAGFRSLLRGANGCPEDTQAWLAHCNGCGECIPACPEGLNPRRMVMLAQKLQAREDGGTPEVFRKMARAVRLMASMQLLPEDAARVLRHRPTRRPEVVFYPGCNALRTPHVLLDAIAQV